MSTTTTTTLREQIAQSAERLADVTARINGAERRITDLHLERSQAASAGKDTKSARDEIDTLERAVNDDGALRSRLQEEHEALHSRRRTAEIHREVATTHREDVEFLQLRVRAVSTAARARVAREELAAFEIDGGRYHGYLGINGRRALRLSAATGQAIKTDEVIEGSTRVERLNGRHSDGGDTLAALAAELVRVTAAAEAASETAAAIERGEGVR